MTNSDIVSITGLSTGYRLKKGAKIIGSNLSATLKKGELTCLLGPNGSGKSTLLRTLAAFQPAMAGTVTVDGRDLNGCTPAELAKMISIVLTDNFHITGMTAYDVIAMGRSPYTDFWGRLTDGDRRIVEESISMTGVGALAHRRMQTLSDGERQKVMIAKAIAQQTPIIILDEPTAYLDYPSKVQTMILLRRLSRTLGKTVFLSTHDMEHAIMTADRLWLLDREKGLATGTPGELSDNGKIGEYFDTADMRYNAAERRFELRTLPAAQATDT